jgi:NAD(P)-dependent dehydrogenase (short-subunit alcohol dehydrogenase family)
MGAPLNVDMSGKIALVTGATGGIGKEIARGLAKLGATVVIGARSPERGEAAREELSKEAGAKSVQVMRIDVSEPESIRTFAQEFKQKFDKLHVLVNNAGAWFTERKENKQGIELTFATNVLGPYLLTSLLEEPLKAGNPSRVVNVVSAITGNYDSTDLNFRQRKFDGFKAYAQSKTALRMLTWAQADKLKATTTVNATAPGFVKSDFNQNAKGFIAVMINISAKLFAVSPAEGADTPLWAAVAPELAGVTSKYYDGRKEKDGAFREQAAITELERRCEEMLGEARSAA